MKVLQGLPYNELYRIERTSASDSLETAIKKIAKAEDFEEEEGFEYGFCFINYNGDLDKENQVFYAHVSGDGCLHFVDTLKKFSEGYRTEKQWKIKDWIEI
ncbi:MAG: hypothetical protein LLG05_03330 [Porphyromonadaceae bacterium]|nr:hypothetical protein [Porphyromonadaceae bacterium]